MKRRRADFRRAEKTRRGASWICLVFVLVLAAGFFAFSHARMEMDAKADALVSLVRDCPADVRTRTPSRTILQVIDAILHKWEEYSLGEAGEFCVILRLPEEKNLSASEAKDLLEASARWVEHTPDAAASRTLDPRDPRIDLPPAAPSRPFSPPPDAPPPSPGPDLAAPPAYPSPAPENRCGNREASQALPEDVIGADERVRVTDTGSYPWNTIGYIGNSYGGGSSFRGTGFIAGPYLVLTNGHMVYNDSRGGYATEVTFAPGQRQLFEGGAVFQPYGERAASWWQTNNNYIDSLRNDPAGQYNYDYAGVFFDTSFAALGISTYIPLVFNASPTAVNVAGYPREVQGESNSQALWRSYGNVVSILERIVTYLADTSGGNSGSPVWEYFSDSAYRRVVAVHAYGNVTTNGGPRLVTQNLSLIETWLAWRPSGSSPGSGGGGGCFLATAAYGSFLDPHVWTLRKFRDRCLMTSDTGRIFVERYYRHSPPVADWLRNHEMARWGFRVVLTPLVFGLEHPAAFGLVGVLLIGLPSWRRLRSSR